MRLEHRVLALRLRSTFRIAHGASDVRRVVLVRLDGGRAGAGLGEAAPVPYLGDSVEAVVRLLDAARPTVEATDPSDLDGPDAVRAWLAGALPAGGESAAGRAALEVALLELAARRAGASVRALLGLGEPEGDAARTSITLPIAAPDELARLARAARAYPIVKIKLGGERDVEALRIVRRELPRARIRVDANGGWSLGEARAILPELRRAGVELLEQPVEGLGEALGEVRALARPLPVFADEPIRRADDVARAAPHVDGVNVKVQKAGGLLPALEAMREARARGLRVMLGCMIESSLGATAAFSLAAAADLLDLDGPLLVDGDPFEGLVFGAGGEIRAPLGDGLGVRAHGGS